jgi:hypothetical protein
MEAHPMINSEHPASAAQNVTAFAIGIVDQHIKDCQ